MKYYTITEVSYFFNVSRVTIFRWIKEGKLQAIQEDKGREEYKIPESAIPKDKLKPLPEIVSKSSKSMNDTATLLATGLAREILAELQRLCGFQERIATALERLASPVKVEAEEAKQSAEKVKPVTKSKQSKDQQKKSMKGKRNSAR